MPRLFKVTVNGREYEVAVLEITTGQAAHAEQTTASAGNAVAVPALAGAAERQAPAAIVTSAGDVVAGMGGVVVEVLAKVGQPVAAGDRLAVLEAMKMKTPIMATRAGQVSRVLVAAGDAVEAGQVLVSIT